MASLHTLACVVLDNIMERLDIQSHLALSYTCKSLHYPANRYLYSHDLLLWPYKTALLKRSLSHYPANAKFLRHYSVKSINCLNHVWSDTTLYLRTLDIDCPTSLDTIWALWELLISSMHPETRIQAIRFWEATGDLVIKPGCVLPQLFAFRGLVRLELHLMFLNFDFQHIVDQLNCPQ